MIDDSDKAYKESRKRLKYRFGNSAILRADFEKRLGNWPKIRNNDAKGIQEFSDFLQTSGDSERSHTKSEDLGLFIETSESCRKTSRLV